MEVYTKDKPLDYEKNKVAFLLEGAECNISHGDRLSPGNKKRIAREIATSDPECKWTESALAKKLGVIQQTVNTWISDIKARQKAGRNTVILRLNRLGWTHEMIAKVVGLDRNVISRNVQNTKISDMRKRKMNSYGSIAPSNDTDKFADNPDPASVPSAKDHRRVSAVCRMQFHSTFCFPTGPPGMRHDLFLPAEAIRYPFSTRTCRMR